MRLIDADSLLANMDNGIQGTAREYLKYFQMAVKDEPTAYNIDKVMNDLKESAIAHTIVGQQYAMDNCSDLAAVEQAIGRGVNMAREIVKRGLKIKIWRSEDVVKR